MKKLFCLMTLCLGIVSANASELSVEQQVSAEVIVRQIVAKNLLGSGQQARSQTNMLLALVNRQVKAPYTSIRVVGLACDHVIGGKDVCDIDVLDATTDGTESVSRLNVTIEKGNVKRATFTVIAG